jgi:predicted RNA-binding Zn-ribbon protein involved in translation (DUF1610 family)
MLFYEFTDNSPYEKKWVFAPSIHPKSHVVKWSCPECGRAAQYPAGAFDVTVEGGSSFPDVLGCGAYPLLIVSERVLSVLKGAGICCFQYYPVGVTAVQESRVRRDEAPAYFRVEIAGECMIDFAGSGAAIKSVCARCGEVKTQPPMIRRFTIVEGSWDGCDLFRDRRYFPRVSFCTQKFVDLAKANGLTNCRFQQMG